MEGEKVNSSNSSSNSATERRAKLIYDQTSGLVPKYRQHSALAQVIHNIRLTSATHSATQSGEMAEQY